MGSDEISIGEEICRPLRTMKEVLPLIRHHHERWDGSGYPDGLKREEIPLVARVFQILDIYDALTSERPYKRAFTVQEARDVLQEETAKAGSAIGGVLFPVPSVAGTSIGLSL